MGRDFLKNPGTKFIRDNKILVKNNKFENIFSFWKPVHENYRAYRDKIGLKL